MINDTYRERSIKDGTRKDRGLSSIKVTVQGFDQHMPQGTRWSELLHNGENKSSLLKLISKFVQSEDGRKCLRYPFIVTEEEKTYKVEKNQVTFVHVCNNHEEADTRLVL